MRLFKYLLDISAKRASTNPSNTPFLLELKTPFSDENFKDLEEIALVFSR